MDQAYVDCSTVAELEDTDDCNAKELHSLANLDKAVAVDYKDRVLADTEIL